MDVQRSNFSESVEMFRESLSNCSLVALDLEFTGVRGRPESYIDNIEERYSGLRRIASTYKIIQVGLSTFVKTLTGWEAHPYNFYVFPSEVAGFNQKIVLEVSAINFLKENHMDFNTWFYNGIPYLNESQAKELESKLVEINEDNIEDLVLSKNYEQVKMNEITHRIENWLQSEEETFEVAGLNAYLRKYLYNFVKKRFKNVYMESVKTNGSRDVVLVLKKASPVQLAELESKRIEGKNTQFLEKLGFRRIFQMLVDAKKPLIVHNGTLDILFTLATFQEDLPEKYQDFKTLVNRLFPVIYDTRFLLEKIPGFYEEFDRTASAKGLKELYNFLKENNEQKIVLAKPFEKYYDEKYAHEAGFDAFMTGICFIRLAERNSDIETYKNCLPLYKSFFSLKLDADDIFTSENHFYVKGTDVKHLFASLDGISYKYVKEDECFVKPLTEEKYHEMQKVVSDHNMMYMTVEAFFASKKSSSDKLVNI